MSASRTDHLGETRGWLEGLGFEVKDEPLWLEALTHGSTGVKCDYQRLEFLGDRVLGLAIAEWLYGHDESPEGKLSLRLNALVSKRTCAKVARSVDVGAHMRLGKQARDDGGAESDNILCDVIEALLGASLLESGFSTTRDVVHALWGDVARGGVGRSKHPKSALQEWAAGNRRKPPEYALVDRSGPDHASQFTVRVTVGNVGAVEGTAASKQEAETEAARLFMEKFG